MKFVEFKETTDSVLVRYKIQWDLTWDKVLNLMQEFMNNLEDIDCWVMDGRRVLPLNEIPDGLLSKSNKLKSEKDGLMINGKSKIHGEFISVRIGIYFKIIEIKIKATETKLIEDLQSNTHFLDDYVNEIEIQGYSQLKK